MSTLEGAEYHEAVEAMAARLEGPGVRITVYNVSWGEPVEGRTRLLMILENKKHDGASSVSITGNDLEAIEAKARDVLAHLDEGHGDGAVVYHLGSIFKRAKAWYG